MNKEFLRQLFAGKFTEQELYLLKECDLTYDPKNHKLNLHYREPNSYTKRSLEHRRRINELMDSLARKIEFMIAEVVKHENMRS